MKHWIVILLFAPLFLFAQQEDRLGKNIQTKVAMIQNFFHKGDEGELAFWQTKGKVTYAIVNYTDEQNPVFKDLFIAQYREIIPIYKRMISSYDEKDTQEFVRVLIRQEEDYRKLLTPEQLKKYLQTLSDFEKNDQVQADAYNSLFFSESLLNEYKKRT